MKPILVFSNEPATKDHRINVVKHDVVFGLQSCWINPVEVYVTDYSFNFHLAKLENLDNRIGVLVFKGLNNFLQIKKYNNKKMIESIVFLSNGIIKNRLPAIIFDCYFPISDIPIKDIKKFTIVNIN